MRFEDKNFFVHDYRVVYDAGSDTFEVLLRPGGCFEGAYRCIERYIQATAEELDLVTTVPASRFDLRKEMQYWIIERIFEQFSEDYQAALQRQIAWVELHRPGEGMPGEVTIETRSRALQGMLKQLDPIREEVSHAVLSPQTFTFLNRLGILAEDHR